MAGGRCVHGGRECKTSLVLPFLIQKSKPDKSEARVLLKNQVNGPKAGREARWPDCFGVFVLYEKGGIAGA